MAQEVAKERLVVQDPPLVREDDSEAMIDFGDMYGENDEENADMKMEDSEEYELFIRKSQQSMFANEKSRSQDCEREVGSEDHEEEENDFKLDHKLEMMMRKRVREPKKEGEEETTNPLLYKQQPQRDPVDGVEQGPSEEESRRATLKLQAFHGKKSSSILDNKSVSSYVQSRVQQYSAHIATAQNATAQNVTAQKKQQVNTGRIKKDRDAAGESSPSHTGAANLGQPASPMRRNGSIASLASFTSSGGELPESITKPNESTTFKGQEPKTQIIRDSTSASAEISKIQQKLKEQKQQQKQQEQQLKQERQEQEKLEREKQQQEQQHVKRQELELKRQQMKLQHQNQQQIQHQLQQQQQQQQEAMQTIQTIQETIQTVQALQNQDTSDSASQSSLSQITSTSTSGEEEVSSGFSFENIQERWLAKKVHL